MVYKYKAIIKNTRHIVEGHIEAKNTEEARRSLQTRGLIVKELRVDLFRTVFPTGLKNSDIVTVCDTLAELVATGKPLPEAVKMLIEITTSKTLKERLKIVYYNLTARGADLATSFDNAGFPKFFVSQLGIAAQAGEYEQILKELGDWYRWQDEVKGKFKESLSYPVGVILVSLCVVFYLIWSVMPKMEVMFSSLPEVPEMLKVMYDLSMWLHKNPLVFFGGLVLLGLTGFAFRRTIAAYIKKVFLDWKPSPYVLRVPWFKAYYYLDVASLFKALSICFAAGLDLTRSLRLVHDVPYNPHLRDIVSYVERRVRKGESFSVALANKLHMPIVKAYLEVGESAGDYEKTTKKVADYMFKQVDRAVNIVATMLKMVAIMIAGGAVGMFVVKLFTSVYSAITSIQM